LQQVDPARLDEAFDGWRVEQTLAGRTITVDALHTQGETARYLAEEKQ
jgi:hypothetical protein